MATATSSQQPNGVSSTPSQSQGQTSQPTQTTATAQASSSQSQQQQPSSSNANNANAGTPSTSSQAPRPRDARTIELLLTSQGVTSFDSRVPLLLLDFAYRHTSSVLSDALHLSYDPYTTHAGSKPSASSGAVPSVIEKDSAAVSASAVNLAIASRQLYSFRGGNGAAGAGGGGASKDFLQELARERNRVALPRVLANEWGLRLPSERFVLSGMSWGLREMWEGEQDDGEDEEDGVDAMEGVEREKETDDKEGEKADGGEDSGGLADYLGQDADEDEEMEGME